MTAVAPNFHETSQKIFSLVRQLDNCKEARKLEDQVWQAFCMTQENVVEEAPTKTFRKHPMRIDSFSSVNSDEPFVSLHFNRKLVQEMKSSSSEEDEEECDDGEEVISDLECIKPTVFDENGEELITEEADDKMHYKEKKILLKKKRSVRHTRIKTNRFGRIKKKCFVNVASENDLVETQIDKEEKSKRDVVKKQNTIKECTNKEKTTNQNLLVAANDPCIVKKLKMSIEKTLTCMDNIKMLVETGIPPPDGAEDLARRKKRAVEFSARFSRIYLYQIGRQITELNKIMKPQSGKGCDKKVNLHQKLLTTHQIILQAFQAYHHHMPSSIAIGVPEKLKELLRQTNNLCQVHRTIVSTNPEDFENNKNETVIKSMESQCKLLADKIQECCEINSSASLLQSNVSKLTLLGYNIPKQSKLFHKKSLNSRLSMYSSTGRKSDPYWRKAVQTLAYKKFNVPSRYKTSNFKHRPPLVKPTIIEVPSKHKVFEKKSSTTTIKSIKPKPVNDDRIKTMIESVDNKMSTSEISLKEGPQSDEAETQKQLDIKNDLLKPIVRSLFLQFCDENKDMTQAEFEMILQKLLVMVQNDSENIINNNNNTNNKNSNEENELKCDKAIFVTNEEENKCPLVQTTESHVIISQNNKKAPAIALKKIGKNEKNNNKRRQIITESGEKNAKLIHIQDLDSSVCEDKSLKEDENKSIAAAESNNERILGGACKSLQTIPDKEKQDKKSFINPIKSCLTIAPSEFESISGFTASKTCIKISRLPKKDLINLPMLPKDYALSVIKYKLEYHKYSKHNLLYKKTSTIQPWMLTGKIADQLAEELLMSVTREIEINEILDTLYQSEFQ